jgi:hypothetical protein
MASTHLWTRYTTFCLFISSLHIVQSVNIFTNNTLPINVSPLCGNALISDISCSPAVTALKNGGYYSQRLLERVCTSGCDDALRDYETRVRSTCAEQTWNGYFNETLPIAIVPGLLRYQYNQSCLMDSGRYCNIVAAQAATANSTSLSPSKCRTTAQVTSSLICFLIKAAM